MPKSTKGFNASKGGRTTRVVERTDNTASLVTLPVVHKRDRKEGGPKEIKESFPGAKLVNASYSLVHREKYKRPAIVVHHFLRLALKEQRTLDTTHIASIHSTLADEDYEKEVARDIIREHWRRQGTLELMSKEEFQGMAQSLESFCNRVTATFRVYQRRYKPGMGKTELPKEVFEELKRAKVAYLEEVSVLARMLSS